MFSRIYSCFSNIFQNVYFFITLSYLNIVYNNINDVPNYIYFVSHAIVDA